jgi:phenylpropionate dioxygenase-like ring-hydroxylating dioxygenase large terminal subunit
MLKNFWYAVEDSAAIGLKPKRIRVLGQNLVLFRTKTGEVSALSDLCIHRGGALSDGWVDGNCVRCPYHGWKYAQDGACVEIPASPKAPIPRRARVDSYPVIERYGWVWVFLGDLPAAERPPLPVIDVADARGWREIRGEFRWNAHYARVVENGVDIAHTPFVHRKSFGNIDAPQVEDYEVRSTAYGCSATATLLPPLPRGLWKLLRRQRSPVRATVTVYMPNITRLDLDLGKWKLSLIDSNIPVDEHTTLTKYISYRNFFTGAWADGNAKKRMLKIFKEDQPIVEGVRPELLPYDMAAELHLKSDAMGLAYRRLRNHFIDLGWAIDTQALARIGVDRRAAVIPSPRRREDPALEKAWVVPEVPVLAISSENTTQEAN